MLPDNENLFRVALAISRIISAWKYDSDFTEYSIPIIYKYNTEDDFDWRKEEESPEMRAVDFASAAMEFEYPEDFIERVKDLDTSDRHAL